MTKPRDLANSVNSASIPGARLENDAITASKMAPNSVDSSELANDSVSTGKIQNSAITTAKLANGAVTTAKVAGGPAFRAGGGTAVSVPTAVWTKITFGTEQFDTASCYASDRFTPNVAGYYQVNAGVQYIGATSSTALFGLAIYQNGVLFSDSNGIITLQYAGSSCSDLIYLNGTTDYIEIYALHSQGTNQDIVGKYFNAVWIRP